jgi:peptidoglycan/LPS O-acetylase OafA/YrhL
VLVFAICEGPTAGERVVALIVLAVVLLVVVALAALVLRFSRGERLYLVGVYVVALLAGAIVILTPGGLTDDDADYGARTLFAVLAGTACGAVGVALRRRRVATYLLTGAAGGVSFAAGVLALIAGALAITGGCLD